MPRTTLVILLTLTVATSARAAQVSRNNDNPVADNLVFHPSPSFAPRRQMFHNNLDYLNTVQIAVGGQLFTSTSTVYLKLYDGCGNLVAQASQVFDNSGLTTSTSWKFVPVSFGGVSLTYNAYYVLQVELAGPNVVANTDRYLWGRLLQWYGGVGFPEKKQDLMMRVQGTADSAKLVSPNETTNIVCPTRCLLANPSGVENKDWNPRYQLNVIIRNRTAPGQPTGHSGRTTTLPVPSRR